jgi:hypothetical protein
LVDSVIAGDRRKVMSCVRQLRVALATRSFLHRPFRSARAVVRHYLLEIGIRFSPRNIESVCILDPGGCATAGFVGDLLPLIESAAKVVELRYPLSRLPLLQGSLGKRGEGRSAVSTRRLAKWFLEEWLRQFFGKTNLTLRIDANCYFDLLLNPAVGRLAGPGWFARLIGKLLPASDLWILLDPISEERTSTRKEAVSNEGLRPAAAYRAFVKTRERYIIEDVNEPHQQVVETAYAAITDTLALRTEKRLEIRFKSARKASLQAGAI